MVNIYAADIGKLPDPKEFPELMEHLPEERKEKIMKYKQEQSRKQSLGAGLLLQQVFIRHGVLAGEIYFGEHGKPEIAGLHFNLSHSQDMVVCAVSEKPVGCDIEKIKQAPKLIAERFFCENERKYLNTFEGIEKDSAFFRLWTMKESYMKMTGEGMHLGLDQFEMVFEDEVKVYREGEKCDCFVKEYEIPGYKLTVCAEENGFAEGIEELKIYDILI